MGLLSKPTSHHQQNRQDWIKLWLPSKHLVEEIVIHQRWLAVGEETGEEGILSPEVQRLWQLFLSV